MNHITIKTLGWPAELTRQRLFCGVAMAAALTVSSVAHAQSAPSQGAAATQEGATSSNDDNVTQDIVVTAQFRAQNLQETPLAITALNSSMIESRGYSDVADLTSAAPSVSFAPAGGITQGAAMYIRGVGQSDSLPAFEPGVGLYIDDVYYGSMAGSNIGLLDLDRVEILRGPQGTLAGANSEGGAVKLYTKKPRGDGSGYLEAGYGTDHGYLVRGALDLSLIDNVLAFRVSAAVKSQGGYVDLIDFACAHPSQAGQLPKQSSNPDSCKTGEAGETTTKVIRGALRFTPNSRLEINLTADADLTVVNAPAQVLTAINQPVADNGPYNAQQQAAYGVQYDSRFLPPKGSYISYATYNDLGYNRTINPENRSDNFGFSGTLDYEFSSDLKLKSITSWRKSKITGAEDADASPLGQNTGIYFFNIEQFTQELRLNGSAFDKLLEWTVGGFYYKNDILLTGQVNARSALAFFPGGLNFQVRDSIKAEKKAAFATVIVHPTAALTITAGYRYSDSHKDYVFGRIDPNPPGLVTVFGLDALGAAPRQQEGRSDYRLSADYKVTDDILVYGQFATGFKDGGINPTPLTPAQATPFNAEDLKSYEVGLKSELFDRRVRLNIAGYLSKYKNLQLRSTGLDASGATASLTLNTGAATIKGVEVETDIRPIDGLLLSASGSYLDFQYDDLGGTTSVPNGPCMSCTNLYTPEYTAYVAAQYDIDLGTAGKVTPRISANYRSKEFAELDNSPLAELPGYWAADARLGWTSTDGQWSGAVMIENLFDKYYLLHTHSLIYQSGTATSTVSRPRTVMFSIKRMF